MEPEMKKVGKNKKRICSEVMVKSKWKWGQLILTVRPSTEKLNQKNNKIKQCKHVCNIN